MNITREKLIKELHKTDMDEEAVAIWSLGQSGILLKGKSNSGFICIDPYLTSSIEEKNPGTEFVRAFPPPLGPTDLSGASGVLVTHDHDDHLDLSTLVPIASESPETRFAAPAPSISVLKGSNIKSERLIQAKEDNSFSLDGFDITPLGSAHTEYQTDEEGDHFYLGYFITVNGVRIYHSGDTVVTSRL